MAPHLAEEAWAALGLEGLAIDQPWPEHVPALLVDEEVTIAVQVNGKLRDRVPAPSDASKDALLELARGLPNVQSHVDGREVVKEIVVPGKLVNLVVR